MRSKKTLRNEIEEYDSFEEFVCSFVKELSRFSYTNEYIGKELAIVIMALEREVED